MASVILEKMKIYSKTPRVVSKLVVELNEDTAEKYKKLKEKFPYKITDADFVRRLIQAVYEEEFLENK